ncbi:hypothetical protein AB6A23_24765 [Paenibacillus tarimensis]
MQKSLKVVIAIAAGVAGLIWLIFAIGFGFFGLLGFFANATEKGFRATLCGTAGCSNTDYFFSVAWLLGMIFLIYILPIIILILLVRKRRMTK